MAYSLEGLFAFLDEGVSPFHVAAASCRILSVAGFVPLYEDQPWLLCPGQGYYLVRGGTAVAAFRLPAAGHSITGWRVSATHDDSPTWRVKAPAMKAPGGVVRLETEGYGGMLMHSWFDRPLTVAGQVILRTAQGVRAQLVHLDRDLCCIPSLAIHMDRAANEGHKFDVQAELMPLFGTQGGVTLQDLISAEPGVDGAELLSMQLTLTPRQKAVRAGSGGEFFLSPRIDDLECAYTTLMGFLTAKPDSGVCSVWTMLDNEEVGSGTRQGALGDFLPRTLNRIADTFGMTPEEKELALAGSFALSCDNAHAIHPAFPQKADPENAPRLNGGVVIKQSANQKYTTGAMTAAVFGEVCARADIPTQSFANRAGQPGGSTLGNLQSRTVSIPMLDVGLAQLAMHSAVETAGTLDATFMAKAAEAFYSARIEKQNEAEYIVR